MAKVIDALPDYLLDPNVVLLDDIPWRHGQVSCACFLFESVHSVGPAAKMATGDRKNQHLSDSLVADLTQRRLQTTPKQTRIMHRVWLAIPHLQHCSDTLSGTVATWSHRQDCNTSSGLAWGACDQPGEELGEGSVLQDQTGRLPHYKRRVRPCCAAGHSPLALRHVPPLTFTCATTLKRGTSVCAADTTHLVSMAVRNAIWRKCSG